MEWLLGWDQSLPSLHLPALEIRISQQSCGIFQAAQAPLGSPWGGNPDKLDHSGSPCARVLHWLYGKKNGKKGRKGGKAPEEMEVGLWKSSPAH